MTITAEMVKKLRERTGLGMMACRKALLESEGDEEKSIELLRKKGELKAAKKAAREVKDGGIAVHISEDKTCATMVEVNCETDFAARNPEFRALVEELACAAAGWDFSGVIDDISPFDTDGKIAARTTEAIAKIGENMILRRAAKIKADNGIVGHYVHGNFKIGAIIELDCPEEARDKQEPSDLAKELCMQAVSLNAVCTSRDQVPADIVEKERAIYREQVKNKPENIQDKIIDGKINAFYKENVLVEQDFIKESKMTVSRHIEEVGKAVGTTLAAKQFVRFNTMQD